MLIKESDAFNKKWINSKNKKCLVIPRSQTKQERTYIVESLQKKTMKKLLK